jgi:hypothetical protein
MFPQFSFRHFRLCGITPAATGHCKLAALKVAVKPGLDNLAQVTGHKGDYTDSRSHNHRVQRPGDSAAYQRAYAKPGYPKDLLSRKIICEKLLRFGNDPPRLSLDNTNLTCNIEDRRYPVLPVCKRRFHYPVSLSLFTQVFISKHHAISRNIPWKMFNQL